MKLSAVAIGSVILITIILLFRFYGSINNFIENADFALLAEDAMDTISEGGGDLSVRDAFYMFILNDNNFVGFNSMGTYIRLLLFPLPTQWSLGLKPVDFAETMGWAYDPSQGRGYSMHPTLYGDCFANAYYFGIFLSIFWAIIIYLIDKFVDSRENHEKLCAIVMVGCAFVMVGRGSAYNPIVSLIYEFILLILVHRLTIFIVNRRKKTKRETKMKHSK